MAYIDLDQLTDRYGASMLLDLATLEPLTEHSLVTMVSARYEEASMRPFGGGSQHGLIYTRAGPVLVAMNPFMRLPELYADAQLATYQKSTAISAGADSDGPRDEATVERWWSASMTRRGNWLTWRTCSTSTRATSTR